MIKEAILSCALALPQATWKPPLTDADKVVLNFMAMMTQSQTMADVLIIKKPWKWKQVLPQLMSVPQGGFVLIEGSLWYFHSWFFNHGWMHMPFMWRKFHLYKKQVFRNDWGQAMAEPIKDPPTTIEVELLGFEYVHRKDLRESA